MWTKQDNNVLETYYIKDEISKCEDVEELKEKVIPLIKTQQEQWAKKVAEIINQNHYTKTEFANLCETSRVTIDKWCKGSIPKNRETFLKIGMAANYDIEQMNQLLQRCGRYPALYSKSLEDCICMFVLERDFGKESFSKYKYILDKVKESIIREELQKENLSTAKFDKKLYAVQSEDELERFIAENIAMFSYSYHKFYAYVKMCIEANWPKYANSWSDFAVIQKWSSSLRQSVSAIYQNKWYPTRNKIISLGLHLSMDQEQINDMLKLAHMEPLCAKNIFEGIIIFILEDASLNDMLDSESEEFDPDGLCEYAREVLSNFDLPEIDFFLSELPDTEEEWNE